MPTSTVRISEMKRNMLRELATWTGEPMQTVLERAIEHYRRELFLERANAAFAALRNNAAAWKDELEERGEWDATIADGLEEE